MADVDLIPLIREALRAWSCELGGLEFSTPALDEAMEALCEVADKIETERHETALPPTLRDLPAWHLSRPECAAPWHYRKAWGLALPDGRVGATDGAAILLVADGPEPPLTHEQFLSRDACASRIERIIDVSFAHEMDCTYDGLRRWLDAPRGSNVVRLGDCRLDAHMIEAWVCSAVRGAAGSFRVRWSSDALNQVRFEGEEWVAVVMPRRHAPDEEMGPDLAAARGEV